MSFSGSLAEQALHRFNISKAFFSCRGLDLDRGLSETSEPQAAFKSRMMELSEQTYLLIDHSKFGVKSSFFFAGPEDTDVIVTDDAADAPTIEKLQAGGKRVIRVTP